MGGMKMGLARCGLKGSVFFLKQTVCVSEKVVVSNEEELFA
jgi:hypothetical protein